jgi:uncharacterized phiE125 gp8 family phage protein
VPAPSPECAWSLTLPPVLEPLTVEEAKAQIRSVQNQEDGVVDGYIKAARALAENHLFRGLLTQSWTFNISDFLDVIWLPMAAPLQSVTHVKYYDVNGAQQTLSTSIYTVDTRSRPGRIALAAGQTWPAIQSLRKVDRIEIQYIVGYTSRELIPNEIRQGIRLLIGYLDHDRDGLSPDAERALEVAKTFWTDRVFWIPPRFEAVY